MKKHLLINPTADTVDYTGLCGINMQELSLMDIPANDSFTLNFCEATCNDCLDLELHYILDTKWHCLEDNINAISA